MFSEIRYQISQWFDEEGFGSLDQSLLMCEMVDLSTASAIKTKNDRENIKRGYEGQI